jgi:purine-cytosine permease-like protein
MKTLIDVGLAILLIPLAVVCGYFALKLIWSNPLARRFLKNDKVVITLTIVIMIIFVNRYWAHIGYSYEETIHNSTMPFAPPVLIHHITVSTTSPMVSGQSNSSIIASPNQWSQEIRIPVGYNINISPLSPDIDEARYEIRKNEDDKQIYVTTIREGRSLRLGEHTVIIEIMSLESYPIKFDVQLTPIK